jgi:type IV pilus assembly protein PilQ
MTDIASVIEQARNIVKEFDTPVKQIMIEARIVDATSNFIRDLGIQWNTIEAQRRNDTGVGFGIPTDASSYSVSGGKLYGGNFSTNAPGNWVPNIALSFGKLSSGMLGAITLDAALALSETEGKTKTISAPKVIAREGTSASISSGDSIIIPATENVASTTLDATLSLTVTPTAVSVNDYITLDVEVTDDQAPTNTRLLKKSITTTLMVRSGETIVIGGIYRENEGEDETGAPYLKDIPILGWLFRAEEKTSAKSELLIFLTPTVLPPPGKAL